MLHRLHCNNSTGECVKKKKEKQKQRATTRLEHTHRAVAVGQLIQHLLDHERQIARRVALPRVAVEHPF